MIRTPALFSLATCGVVLGVTAPTFAAAESPRPQLAPIVQTWMGLVSLLADDGERGEARREDSARRGDSDRERGEKGECRGDCGGECERCKGGREQHGDGGHARGEHHRRGHAGHGPEGDHAPHAGPGPHAGAMHRPGAGPHAGPMHHGRMGPGGPQSDVLSMLRDISGRLARIEAMLAARGPGAGGPAPTGPGRGPSWGGGPGRGGPAMTPEMREQWQQRMREGQERMREFREKWEKASPEEREAMKKEWEQRMRETRERMRAPAERQGESQDSAAGRPAAPDEMRRMVEQRLEEAGRRMKEMSERIKRLEAELERMRTEAGKRE